MTYLVCAFTWHFADDVHARCATCDVPVVHRPNVPPHAVKICGPCAQKVFDANPDTEVRVTEKTLRELMLYDAKTSGIQ